MKSTIRKRDLLEALDRVRATTASSDMVQILKCFCFRKGFVSTYSGQAGTITALDIGGLDFCVLADKFYRLMSAMTEVITFDFNENTGVLKIGSGGNKTTLPTIPTRAFPDFLPREIHQYSFAPNFVEGLKRVSFSISANATKVNLMGVGARGDYLYSSDGKRVSRYKIAAPVPSPLTIPADVVVHVTRLGQPEQFFRTDNQIGAYYPSTHTHYVANLIAMDFPFTSADDAITMAAGNVLTEFPEELEFALERVALLCPEENSEVLIENTAEGLVISSASDQGSGREVLVWNYTEHFKFAANPSWFKQAFAVSRKVDLTNVIKGDRRLLLFKTESFEHLLALMSMKD